MTVELFQEITRALERAFPGRAELIVACLVERLPAGPWDETRPPVEEIGAADYDELRIETHRALRAYCEDGEHAVGELDAALRAAVIERLMAMLAFRAMQSPGFENPADWACDALSAGFDEAPVRELAGLRNASLWDLDRIFRSLVRDLKIPLSPDSMFRSVVRTAAKQFARGQLSEEGWSRVLHSLLYFEPASRALKGKGLDLQVLDHWDGDTGNNRREMRRQISAVLRGELPT